MDRRLFLRTGGLALLGSMAAGSSLSAATSALQSGPLVSGKDAKASAVAAMNHFGVSESDMRKVLATALEKGGDYADLFFQHTSTNVVSLKDGAVNSNSSYIDFGMGVDRKSVV